MERSRQPAFFDHCKRVFAAHGFTPRTVKEPLDHHVLLASVAFGRAAALLPASFKAIKRDGVSYKTLKEGRELAVGVGLALHTDRSDIKQCVLRCIRA